MRLPWVNLNIPKKTWNIVLKVSLMCANNSFLWKNMKNNVVSLFFNKFWWTQKWHRKYATKRYFEGFVDSECAACHTIIKLSQFVVLCWDNKFLHFFSICDHQAQFWSCTYPACRKIRKKKLLTKTKISKFLCTWYSTGLLYTSPSPRDA